MSKLINGTDFVVKFGSTAGAEEVIYCSTTCTLNVNAETVSASCKSTDGSWAKGVEGTKSWDVSVDGLYAVNDLDPNSKGFVDLMDLFVDPTVSNEVSVVIGSPDADSGDTIVLWDGMAILTSASVTAPDGEITTWSATFTGNGPLKVTKTVKP